MKKSTLASVESLIPLLENTDYTLLRAERQAARDAILPWRRRSRIRRILNRIRQIQRTNSALHIEYYRLNTDIYVYIPSQNLILFDLLWPNTLPTWLRVESLTA